VGTEKENAGIMMRGIAKASTEAKDAPKGVYWLCALLISLLMWKAIFYVGALVWIAL
jgi:hypothetical protein